MRNRYRSPDSFRARVAAVQTGKQRPLWSVMIPSYNCAAYLPETLRSVLAQGLGPDEMQIEVVDDASSDDPERVVRDVGQGRIAFFQQARNVGHIENFDTCLARATGHIVHLLHGDDLVKPGFYDRFQAAFASNPDIGAAFCRHEFIDESGRIVSTSEFEQSEPGVLPDALERLAREQRITTPSIVVKRSVYERLGSFDRRLVCSEDWEMWVRIAAHYPVWYEPRSLACYRMHLNSNTGRHIRTGEDMAYTRVAIEMFKSYLPPQIARHITQAARRTYAGSALSMAERMLAKGDFGAFAAQVREAFRLSCGLDVCAKLAQLVIRYCLSVIGLRKRPRCASDCEKDSTRF